MTDKNLSNKPKVSKPRNRLFLVVADDSKELHQALYYAARRAATANGEVALFRCIEPIEGQLWGGVTEIMEAEAEQASKKLLLELSEYCETVDSDYTLEVSQLKSRVNNLIKRNVRGVLEFEEKTISRNEISQSIIHLISLLEKEKK